MHMLGPSAYWKSQNKALLQEKQTFAFDRLTNESEIALIKEIAKLDLVVENAAQVALSEVACTLCAQPCDDIQSFYEKVPVLREQDNEVRMARLGLVKAFGIALKNTLEVLGITALDRM